MLKWRGSRSARGLVREATPNLTVELGIGSKDSRKQQQIRLRSRLRLSPGKMRNNTALLNQHVGGTDNYFISLAPFLSASQT
jgi:hypothetical protein